VAELSRRFHALFGIRPSRVVPSVIAAGITLYAAVH